MVEKLDNPSPAELDFLTALWEASVRATHDFLAPEDLAFYREIVRREALKGVDLYVIRGLESATEEFGGFAAFAGVDGDMLEMLFVAPAMRGMGLGSRLVEFTVAKRGVRRVDVNEQNSAAAGFYARLGFHATGRDATDPSGRPYPILHLSLPETLAALLSGADR